MNLAVSSIRFENGLVSNKSSYHKCIHGHTSLVEDVEGLLVPVPLVPHISSGYMYYEMKICDWYVTKPVIYMYFYMAEPKHVNKLHVEALPSQHHTRHATCSWVGTSMSLMTRYRFLQKLCVPYHNTTVFTLSCTKWYLYHYLL